MSGRRWSVWSRRLGSWINGRPGPVVPTGRAGRCERLVGSFGVAVELVVAGVRAAPQRALTAWAGHTAALAMVAASPVAGRLDEAYLEGGALLVATVAVGAAAAVDRRELRSMAVADVCGASRLQRRLVVLVEAVLFGLAAVPSGLAAGAAICAAAGAGGPRIQAVVGVALPVPALVGLFAGRLRTRVTLADAAVGAGVRTAAGRRRRVELVRILVGIGLVAAAALLSRGLRAFWELDVALGPLLALAAVGLVLAVPPLVGWLGAGLERAGALPVALAGTALRERRRVLAPAVALGAVAAMVVAVQAVVGTGLAERERLRREHVDGSRLTAGLGDTDVFVGRTERLLPYAWANDLLSVPGEPGYLQNGAVPAAVLDAVRSALPDARVAGVEVLPLRVAADPVVPSALARRVAVGTPELVAALGLQRFAGDLAAGRALVLDPSAAVDGRVVLSGSPMLLPDWHRDLPARLVQHRVVPQYQPAVLVAPALGLDVAHQLSSGWLDANPAALVVGRDRGFSPAELDTIAAAVHGVSDGTGAASGLEVVGGSKRLSNALEMGRLDESYAVVLESDDDVRVAMAVAAIVSLVALAVALRLAALTGRPDDELLTLLGARPATRRAAAVVQALVLGLLAVPLGAAVGVAATRVGVGGYNSHGRFADGVELPPIPATLPPALVVGALLVPITAAIVGGIAARRRRPLDLPSLADRLAW